MRKTQYCVMLYDDAKDQAVGDKDRKNTQFAFTNFQMKLYSPVAACHSPVSLDMLRREVVVLLQYIRRMGVRNSSIQ
jgi:hypothetical protein